MVTLNQVDEKSESANSEKSIQFVQEVVNEIESSDNKSASSGRSLQIVQEAVSEVDRLTPQKGRR